MADFISKEESDKLYSSKSKGNAALTLGIIGTALAASNGGIFGNNDGCCCGGGNNGGILGGLFGNRGGNNGCCEARQARNAADAAMMTAMAQGQIAQSTAWANRVQSMQDDIDLYTYVSNRDFVLNDQDWKNRVASMEDDANLYTVVDGRINDVNNRLWENRVASMNDSANVYSALNNKIESTDQRLSDQVQLLTNQSWMRREQDLQEKFDIYARSVASDNAINQRICNAENQEKDDKFYLYTQSTQADAAIDNKFTKLNYEGRIQDLNEKFDLYTRLNNKITELEKQQAQTATALPLMFELNKVNSERYTDACCCKSENNLLMTANGLQRQLDHKIDGQLKYAYSDLCAPVPSISPLYCSPFTPNGSGTTWTGCCNNGCQSL